MRKFILSIMALLLIAALSMLVACKPLESAITINQGSGEEVSEHAPESDYAPEAESEPESLYEPEDEPEEPPAVDLEPEPEPDIPPPTAGQSLLGSWSWMDMPYYVFEANGRGTMTSMPITWSTSNGVLSICNTPNMCGSHANCLAPMEWYYVLDGNQLTLTSRLISSMVYVYTRE